MMGKPVCNSLDSLLGCSKCCEVAQSLAFDHSWTALFL